MSDIETVGDHLAELALEFDRKAAALLGHAERKFGFHAVRQVVLSAQYSFRCLGAGRDAAFSNRGTVDLLRPLQPPPEFVNRWIARRDAKLKLASTDVNPTKPDAPTGDFWAELERRHGSGD